MSYPEGYGRCVMCGAGRTERCTIISGGGPDGPIGDRPGDIRPYAHTARALIGANEPAEGSVAVRDEPNHYRGEPHTPQCREDCPLPP